MNAGDAGSRRTRSISSSISCAVGRRSGSTISSPRVTANGPRGKPTLPQPHRMLGAMGSSFGVLFRITTFGESHGPALGVVIDGCPPRLTLDLAQIQAE